MECCVDGWISVFVFICKTASTFATLQTVDRTE
jgi:hypothetical protein